MLYVYSLYMYILYNTGYKRIAIFTTTIYNYHLQLPLPKTNKVGYYYN